jgi:hypothetical protein
MAIVTLPAPCWYLVRDGQPHDPYDHGPDHFESKERAFAGLLDDDDHGLTAAQYDKPCIEVTCIAGCGEAIFEDYDTGRQVHFPDLDTTLTMLRAEEWIVGFANAAWHDDCAPDRWKEA